MASNNDDSIVPLKKHHRFLQQQEQQSQSTLAQPPPQPSSLLPGKKRFLAYDDPSALPTPTTTTTTTTNLDQDDVTAFLHSKKHRAFGLHASSSSAGAHDAVAVVTADHQLQSSAAVTAGPVVEPPAALSSWLVPPSARPAAPVTVDLPQQQPQSAVLPDTVVSASVTGTEQQQQQQPESRRAQNERGQAIYCICQLPYDGRPMIGCDVCDEWYHLGCIGVSDARAAALAHQKYVCFRCARDNGVELERRRHRSCVAPKCQTEARPHSRYCSDECGVAHATFTIRRAHQKEIEARERAAEERRVERRRRKAIAAQTRERAALEELERIVDAANVDVDALVRTGDALNAHAVLVRLLGADERRDQAALIDAAPLNVRYDAQRLVEIEAQLRQLRTDRVLLERRAATARCIARAAARLLSESGAESTSTAGAGGANDEDAGDENMSVECPTCGKLVSVGSYARHIATCYATQEATHVAASSAPPAAPATMFCDAFDAKTKTYCKKLKCACPFHGLAVAPPPPARKATAEEKAADKRKNRAATKSGGGRGASAATNLCAFPAALVDDAALDVLFQRLLGTGNDDDALATFPPLPSGDNAYSAVAVVARLDERLEALQDRFDEAQLTLDLLQPCREHASSCPRHSNWGLLAEMRLLQEAIRIETDEHTLHNSAAESRARIEKRVKQAKQKQEAQ
jgi:hypothetical protein